MKKSKKTSHLYKNNWVAIGLLFIGVILALIGIVGYTFNPLLFSSFSWGVFIVIVSISVYMLYNIKKIGKEMKHKEKNQNDIPEF